MASTEGNKKIALKRKTSPKLRKKFSNSILKGKFEAALSPSKLKIKRIEKSLSQDDLAKKLKMSQASYAAIESKRRKVKPDRAQKIAKLLKVKDTDIFLKNDNGDRFIAI